MMFSTPRFPVLYKFISMNNCLNCGAEVESNYCPQCGQKTSISRFTILYLLKRAFINTLDLDGPFISTLWILLTRPGHAIREYVEGRRVSLFDPGKLLILMGAISTLVVIHYNAVVHTTQEDIQFLQNLGISTKAFFEYGQKYNTLVNLIALPVFSLFTWTFFSSKYNYAENLVLNTYISAIQLGLLVIALPIIEFNINLQNLVIGLYSAITLVYYWWVTLTFFEAKKFVHYLAIVGATICSYVGQFLVNFVIFSAIRSFI